MGNQPKTQEAWVKVNQALLQSSLHHCKKVTLDIDATEVIARLSIGTINVLMALREFKSPPI